MKKYELAIYMFVSSQIIFRREMGGGGREGQTGGFEIFLLGLFIKYKLPMRGTTFFCPFKIALNSLPS